MVVGWLDGTLTGIMQYNVTKRYFPINPRVRLWVDVVKFEGMVCRS